MREVCEYCHPWLSFSMSNSRDVQSRTCSYCPGSRLRSGAASAVLVAAAPNCDQRSLPSLFPSAICLLRSGAAVRCCATPVCT